MFVESLNFRCHLPASALSRARAPRECRLSRARQCAFLPSSGPPQMPGAVCPKQGCWSPLLDTSGREGVREGPGVRDGAPVPREESWGLRCVTLNLCDVEGSFSPRAALATAGSEWS